MNAYWPRMDAYLDLRKGSSGCQSIVWENHDIMILLLYLTWLVILMSALVVQC